MNHGALSAAASPGISEIVLSYNSGPFMCVALTSALHQEPPPHEMLALDGWSTDDTLDMLPSFGERADWISERDGWQTDASNKALAIACGDVVRIWLSAHVETAQSGLVEATTPLPYSSCWLRHASGKALREDT
jgi:hypothetical protein